MLQPSTQLSPNSPLWVTFLAVAFAALLCTAHAQSVQPVPQFRDYPAKSPMVWLPGSVDFTVPDNRKYRTRLIAASKQRANFAGHYVLSTWGCDGPQCLTGAILNLPTGRAIFLPEVCCWGTVDDNFKPFEFRADSRLVVLSGQLNGQAENAAHFFELKNEALALVSSKVRPQTQRIEPAAGKSDLQSTAQTTAASSQEALYRAIANNEIERVNAILTAGTDPNGRLVSSRIDTTPLHLAIRKHSPQIVDLLLARDADITALEESNRSVLWVAVNINDTATVHKLLNRSNAESIINTQDADFGYTPLHRAVDMTSVELVTSLLKAGAKSDLKSLDGETVRDICARRSNISCKALLNNGR